MAAPTIGITAMIGLMNELSEIMRQEENLVNGRKHKEHAELLKTQAAPDDRLQIEHEIRRRRTEYAERAARGHSRRLKKCRAKAGRHDGS